MLFYAAHPTLDLIERFPICDIKDKEHSISVLVKRVGDCSESLLSRSVPNLHINLVLSWAWGVFRFNVVQPNRGNMVLIEYAFPIPEDERGYISRIEVLPTAPLPIMMRLIKLGGMINWIQK